MVREVTEGIVTALSKLARSLIETKLPDLEAVDEAEKDCSLHLCCPPASCTPRRR